MGLKFKVGKLEDVAESQREFYTERDGAFYLDIEEMPSSKTDEDVRKLRLSLDKERADHKATKEKLRAFDEFGSIEDLRGKLDELNDLKESGGKMNNDELLEYKKRLRSTEKERDSFKTQYEEQQTRFNELLKLEKDGKVRVKAKELVKSLPDNIDKQKANDYLEDFIGTLDLDDTGEIAPINGKEPLEWLKGKATLFGFTVSSTPGQSHPSRSSTPNTEQAKQKAYEEAKAKGDIFAMLNNTAGNKN